MTPQVTADAFADLAEVLHAEPTPSRTAEEIVSFAQQELDADYAGITLIRARNKLETIAPTDPLVCQVDILQYELDEGPCRDSSWHRQTLISEDLASDDRWPQWAPKVVAIGIASALAVELTGAEGRRLGAINLYWTERRQFGSDDIAFANLFARHAAIGLANSMDLAGLNIALDGRKLIGQAQGILMERFDLDETRAFEVLRRYSQEHNLKLRRVAEHLIETRRLPAPHDIGSG
jgi:GAF domain-containing protein